MIGFEGVTGLAVIMGATRSPNATYIQLAGKGFRISAANLRSAMDKSPTLQKLLLQYAHVFMMQTAQTALANGRNKMEDRLARWLLMAHDRVGGNDLALTHEFLGIMLGVRRSGRHGRLGCVGGQRFHQRSARHDQDFESKGARKTCRRNLWRARGGIQTPYRLSTEQLAHDLDDPRSLIRL